jgi:hypothetical protein
MTDGPIDRFKATRQRSTAIRKAERLRLHGSTATQAEKIAEKGEKFICRDCREWHPRSEFEYVYNDETKLASRCSVCREVKRILNSKKWKK